MSNNSKRKIILKFESDWHVGTGTGIPGSTDKLVFRDADGFPAVPAKTLNGIWRDAIETLCDGLGGDWANWVEFIFGIQPNNIKQDELERRLKNDEKTYSFSILNLRSARISEKLRGAIGDDERLKQSLTFIKAGIAIDNASGTTIENHLRFEEMGRSGTILEAEFDLQTESETAKALLVLSSEFIERIGGKRRRGAGKCKFEVQGLMSKDDAIKHLESFENKDAPEIPRIPETFNDIDLTKADNSTEWQTLEYRLTLQTPISIVTAVLGNVSESLDFIPGTYLLPHITKNLGKNVRSAVANGDFQVSPAMIEIDGERGYAIPKVFAQEKMNKSQVYNRLLENLGNKKQTKPIREGYISDLNSGTLSIEKTPQTLMIHNTVEDSVQRPTSDVGGVFSREAIKAGTVLRGKIRWKKSLNLKVEDFKKSPEKDSVRLGTSKKDDYGLAKFEVFVKESDEKDERKLKNELVVYLASDVLLRNDNLRQTNLVVDLAEKLGKKLGAELTEAKTEGLISSIIQVRRIESWQVSWGFPRPTLTAMAAGSVVVFNSDKDLIFDDLKKIEAEGIGERRGEGYGQIIFNPPLLMNSVKIAEKKDKKEAKKGDVSKLENLTEELEFAKQIERTAWREELKIAVLKIADEADLRKEIFGFEIKKGNDVEKSNPPMSQIGGLRSVISRLKSNTAEDKKIVSDWLRHLKQTSNRFEKWGDNRNDKFTALENLIQQDKKIWLILFQSKNKSKKRIWKSIPKFLRRKKEIREELWAEAIRALFYACQHAHKRDLEKPEQKKEAANG